MWSGEGFEPQVEAFLAALRLVAPPPEPSRHNPPPNDGADEAAHGAATNPTGAEAADARLFGRWNRSASSSPHYADPASWGASGYTKSRYEFRSDGTYVYTERAWSPSFTRILVVKERGTFVADARTVTVQPEESVIEAYAKKNGTDELGARIESKKRHRERTTYRYGFHYFEGLQLWNLVLQAERPTLRDGRFSSNTTYANAWYFDQRFTDTDLTSTRGK
jgi:hypothetical protein